MKKTLIIFLLSTGVTLGVNAQQAPTAPPAEPKKVFYDFNEVDILGNIKKPIGGSVVQTPEIRFKRLLNLDESFIPEIINGIDEY